MVNTEICHCVTTLNVLMHTADRGKIDLINSDQKKIAKLIVNKCDTERIPSFTDYIKSGWQISDDDQNVCFV